MLSSLQNKRLLRPRISSGDLDQYFDPGYNELIDLANSRYNDDFEEMATILQNNISSGGQGIEPLLIEAYDSEIEDLVDNLLNNFFKDIEVRAINSFERADVDDIRESIDELEDFPNLRGFIRRKQNILFQLKEANRKLSIPENIEEYAVKLIKNRGKDVTQVKTTKIVNKWGRWGKKALVTWGKRGILAVKFLDVKIPKPKKPKLKFIPTKQEFRNKTALQILSRRGTKLTIKERLFLDSRRNKTHEEIYNDYIRVFGRVRTKTEVMKHISEY